MRSLLRRANKAFRRLGNGSWALAGLIFAAFIAAVFDGKLTVLPAFIIVTAAIFLALAGYIFHLQADMIDLGDADDR